MKHEEWTFRKDTDDAETRAAQVRYWQNRPAWERFEAIAELSTAEYLRKHPEALDQPPVSGWKDATVRFLPFPEGLEEK